MDVVAEFRFSRLKRVATFGSALFCGLSSFLVAIGVAIAIMRSDRSDMWFMLAVASLLALYLGALARLSIKYGYITRTQYSVSASGISVVESGRQYFVPWDRFATAEFMPLVSVFRLLPADEQRPIVLFTLELGGYNDPMARRSRIAEQHIRNGLQGRLRRKWVPW